MRKFLRCSFVFLAIFWGSGALADVNIDATNFPDANFRAYVKSNCDTNSDDVLSDSEISEVIIIGLNSRDISSLQGIGYFTALTVLDCRYNRLTSLDMSDNTALTSLYCYSNQLTSLNVSNNAALTHLHCYDNKLTTLNLSNNIALTTLNCYLNQLISLNLSNNTALTLLQCYKNQLTTLDLSSNTALRTIDCHSNQLTSLNIDDNTTLQEIRCSDNHLTAIDISSNTALTFLSCESNDLATLDVSNNGLLTDLWCGNNKLTALDVSSNTNLLTLDCYNNQLKALDVSSNISITDLFYGKNYLSKLDLRHNTNLNVITDAYYDSNVQTVSRINIVSTDMADYPVEFDFSTLSIDASEFTDRVVSIDARNESKDTIAYTTSSSVVRLASLPSTISYYYDTQATSASVEKYMNVILSSFDISIEIRTISPDVTIISPDTKIITLSSDGGSFDNVIVSVSGDYDDYSFSYSGDITASMTQSGDVWIISGSAPANLTSFDVSYDIDVLFSRNTFSGKDSFTVVVTKIPDTSEEHVYEPTLLESVTIISPDTKIITLSSDGGLFDNVIVFVSGDYDSHSLSYSGDISASMTQSGDVWIISGTAPANLTSFDVSYNIKVIFEDTVSVISDTFSVVVKAKPEEVIIEDDSDEDDTKYESVASRSWRYKFSMSTGLQSKLISKFGLSDSSSIFQFNDSEILDEAWILDSSDLTAITNKGESVIMNIPTVKPSNTGVYVMRYSLGGATPGAKLLLYGISTTSVSVSELQNVKYVFYDEDYNEVSTVPENGVVYVAMNLTAGNTSRGVITTAISRATISPIVSNDELINNIVANVAGISTSADVKFITEDQIISEVKVPTQELKEKAASEDHVIIGNLGTVNVDEPGYYVMKITLSDDLYEQVKDVKVEDLKVYYMISGDKPLEQLNASFVGLLNTAELLTLKGEKLRFGTREFLLAGFLNSGQPISLFIAKVMLAFLTGGIAGCNGGIGILGLVLIIAFRISQRKQS